MKSSTKLDEPAGHTHVDDPLAQYHTILHSALKAALLDGLLSCNVASIVVGKPRVRRDHSDVRKNCWEVHEANAFLKSVKVAGRRPGVLHAGARLTSPQGRAVWFAVERSGSGPGGPR